MPQKGYKKGTPRTCTECGKEFYKPPSRAHELRCSKACANIFISRQYKADPAKSANLRRAAGYRDFTSPAYRTKLSAMVKQCFRDGRLKPRYGADNNLWKGGVASLQNTLRKRKKYKAWRTAVFSRDHFRCVRCKKQDDLHAHHIKAFAAFPRLRYAVANGMTLCQGCHSKEHGRHIPNVGAVNRR